VDRFIQAAGGPEAPIVVVPTADGREGTEPAPPGFERTLAAAGATNVRTFHAANPGEVAKAKSLDFLKTAKGLWFGGGRQWRLVDAYAGTEAEAAFHAVLARGGVIAGSSAGCSIQAQFMVRGNPLGNREIAFEGYEQGFGFLPGCGVDQHFFRRNRRSRSRDARATPSTGARHRRRRERLDRRQGQHDGSARRPGRRLRPARTRARGGNAEGDTRPRRQGRTAHARTLTFTPSRARA
jgi:cyanophycinase-like exopeptidase